MLNKNSMSHLISMEASMGLHCDLFDSNRSNLNKLKEESFSEGFRYYSGPYEEQFQPTNPFSMDNTINFTDIDKKFFTPNPVCSSPLKLSSHSPNTEERREWAARDHSSKRGLKQLASLLMKTLHKKGFTSHSEVAL